MKLKKLIKILAEGESKFSILPYCEEYGEGLWELRHEPWYKEIKNRRVKNVYTIGGGCCPVETIIELEKEA